MASQVDPTFSIVIPSYNYAHYLPRAIESVLTQDGHDYEIVIVDDGSTDDTEDVVRRIQASARSPVRYVHQNNAGLSITRNRGIREAVGRYLLFLDADDALCAGALLHVRNALQRHPGVHFIVGGHIISRISGTMKRKRGVRLTADRRRNFSRYLRGDLNGLPSGSVVITRKVFDRLRFPGSNVLWEDIVFYGHMLALYDGVSIPPALVTIYRHADSLGHDHARMTHEYRKALEYLFDPSILTGELMSMRDEFLSIMCLQQFTFLYKRKHYEEARSLFVEGIRTYPLNLLRLRPLRRYLSIVLGFKRAADDRSR